MQLNHTILWSSSSRDFNCFHLKIQNNWKHAEEKLKKKIKMVTKISTKAWPVSSYNNAGLGIYYTHNNTRLSLAEYVH